MSNERFRIAVLAISEICNRINSKDKESLEYVVLQDLPKDDPYLRDPFIMYKIAEFYNQNWVGNVDFMRRKQSLCLGTNQHLLFGGENCTFLEKN